MSHDIEEWCKIWRKTDLLFQKWHQFGKFWPEHSKFTKFLLWLFFCGRYVTCYQKKYRGVIFHDNEDWCKIWRGIDLSFQNWHEEFEEFWLEHLKVSNICTLMGSFRPKYTIFELKKYRIVAWWHWIFMQNLKEK